jgi:hypothetical protein
MQRARCVAELKHGSGAEAQAAAEIARVEE